MATQEQKSAEGAVVDAAKERDRADATWSLVEDLISQMTEKDEADAEGNKAEEGSTGIQR